MKIKKIIVHSIEKEQHQGKESIEINLRDELLPVDDRVTALIDGVRDVYTNKTGKAFGKLGEVRSFSRELKRMYNDEVEFIEFTNIAMSDLKSRMGAESLATGGYILFVDFEKQSTHYFMVVMLKSKDGLSFDDELKLMDAHHLELDRLHFAARINVDDWLNGNEGNHVSFVKGRASISVTEYFKEFLGIEEFSESAKTTDSLVAAVSSYSRQELKLDNNDMEKYKIRVHDYCNTKHEKEVPIFLDELSQYLDEENPTKFMVYAQEKYDIPNEFQVDKAKLRKFLRYYGKDKGISISFASEELGSRVIYDEVKKRLIIYKIPHTLKSQLVAETKPGESVLEDISADTVATLPPTLTTNIKKPVMRKLTFIDKS